LGGFADANPLDSRVAEAEEIFRNPWFIFTTGFLLKKFEVITLKNLSKFYDEKEGGKCL
jgi:hypothetical protein